MQRLLPLLLVSACATAATPVAPETDPMARCGVALADGHRAVFAQACGELFAQPQCRDAWLDDAPDVVEQCAAAYCPALPSLAACGAGSRDAAAIGELFDAALARADPSYDGRVGALLAALVAPVVVTAVQIPEPLPGNVEELRASVALGPEQIVLISALHPDGLTLEWSSGSEAVRERSLARLREELARVKAAYPMARDLVLSASDSVEYGDVIAVMDSVRVDDRGNRLFDHVTFAVAPR